MLRKRVIIDFDSEFITVMVNGVLVKKCPSAVIRKTSEIPVVISYGEDAEKMKDSLGEQEVYCTPFKSGKIVDDAAAKILFRSVLKEVSASPTFSTLYILISGGLSASDLSTIEKTIISIGYRHFYLVARSQVIARLLGFNALNCGLFMNADVTEFVLAKDGKEITSHTIDVSTSALSELLREKFLSEMKLKMTVKKSNELVKKYCSLFSHDNTKIVASGLDAITSTQKLITCYASDLYPFSDKIYSIIMDLVQATILDVDNDLAMQIASSGILFMGSGTHICGFEEYAYKKLGVRSFIEKDESILLAVQDAISENE